MTDHVRVLPTALAGVSREAVACRAMEKALDRKTRLDTETEACFADMLAALQLMRDVGFAGAFEFSDHQRASWTTWLAVHEARERAGAPLSAAESDRQREDQALALANAAALGEPRRSQA